MGDAKLDQESIFLESTALWKNPIVKFLLPFEVLINSAILLTIAWAVPQSRSTLVSVWVLVCVLLPVGMMLVRLVTDLTHEMLRVSYWPFPGWRIATTRIVRAERREIDAVGKLGGWGVKYKKEFGMVLNVVGNDHVVLTLEDGKKRTVGTLDPEGLMDALRFACDLDEAGDRRGGAG